jgi:tetratricopeptide (TPR) repeat protein
VGRRQGAGGPNSQLPTAGGPKTPNCQAVLMLAPPQTPDSLHLSLEPVQPQAARIMSVRANLTRIEIPTYPVGTPEHNPLFFSKRVYQGSSGKVYPLPFIDKVHDEPEARSYQLAVLENEYIYLELLPEIGGRIFKARDKANHHYDFFYRQDVIKPALVGLAGPWISGGVEFNWPQHHRPGTFLPCEVSVEEESDGARTVWMSALDPLTRMKGLHGVRLRPGSAVVELRVRLHNRTPLTQTFLWWANVAARVHDAYQSFFPPDVHYVADHAVRAMSSFPVAENAYYGIDYATRPGANDLGWYRHIPVPTSYMVCETAFGFFGGYDHEARGGFVHVADRHLAPGKKQWTWGNHPFGWAWDRELTDEGGPYVELMAGVYTDNQPDFSYLAPGEEKSFSQFWWPYQEIGTVQQASEDLALRLVTREDGRLDLGVAASREFPQARIKLRRGDEIVFEAPAHLAPGSPWTRHGIPAEGHDPSAFELVVCDGREHRLLSYRPPVVDPARRARSLATEPPSPAATPTSGELDLIGEHLEQYRHPTRDPEAYWHEQLTRDPGDARAHLALGRCQLRRGEWGPAIASLRAALARLTHYHPNPASGETHYHLGLALAATLDDDGAEIAFAKATWDYAWRAPAHYQLAALASRRQAFARARHHAAEALETNLRHAEASVLLAALERRDRRPDDARRRLQALLARDPLCPLALAEIALHDDDPGPFLETFRNDAQTILDVSFFYAHAGLSEEAINLLQWHHLAPAAPVAVPNPLARTLSTHFLLAHLRARHGDPLGAEEALEAVADAPSDHFFPSRLEEAAVLAWVLEQRPRDARAAFGLGNLLYDKGRRLEAIAVWEQGLADASGPTAARLWRNLGIARWNVHRDGPRAREAYANALAADRHDARHLYEFDQLRKRLGDAPAPRLARLEAQPELVAQRDDTTVERAALLNLTGQPAAALATLLARRFHPWEGGEGKVLAQFKAAHLALAAEALAADVPAEALAHCEQALEPPAHLGETWHPLQSQVDLHYWRGLALRALGREDEAREALGLAANAAGDFQDMAVVAHSELSVFRGRALAALGRPAEARAHYDAILAWISATRATAPQIDYFATSLPNLLVFEDDLRTTRDVQLDALAAATHAARSELDGPR